MSELQVARDGATAVVTISHPGKRNAITADMWRAFTPLMAELAADRDVRVVVLTGADGDFSAGSDITGLANPGDASVSADGETAVASFPKPIIAAIHGYCLGGGVQVSLACDLRIAADDAKFGVPPANLGLVYPLPGTRNLVNTIGASATKKLFFTADRIDAAEAFRIGLVDEVVASDQVLPRALELAAHIATKSQLSIQGAKAIIRALERGEDAASVADDWYAQVAGADLPEGQAAFAEKRKPRFTWNGR